MSLLTALLVTVACADAPVAPEITDELTIDAMRWHGQRARPVKVLSRNLYIGFDVDETIAALASGDQDVINAAVAAAIQTLLATDFPTRAGAVAREIDLLRPDVVGLQEVYDIQVNIPPLPAIDLPFLDVLLAKLAERDLHYEVAAQVTDTDAQLPGISLVDHDVVLVRASRVKVLGSDGQLFTANLGDPFGIGIDIVRGWTKIHARIRGVELEIWNTHLESGSDPLIVGLRGLQAAELAENASTGMPVIVMGDLNDELGSPMYDAMTFYGFANVWEVLRPWSDGFTCCHAADLSNPADAFDERIDHVFVRGFESVTGTILLTGKWPWEKVAGPFYPLWASDHAGVYAALRLPRGG
jgi:endonuclease/exonuclease/phosphatase family metal-dependent hydrolase